MKRHIELNFSHQFDGTIWNSALSESTDTLLLEIRDGNSRKTTFSAVNMDSGTVLWRDMTFEEHWWIGLEAARDDIALFSVFTDTANPERKSLIAYDIREKRMLWWRNDFSLSALGLNCVMGITTQYGQKEIVLDLKTGKETTYAPDNAKWSSIRRPSQYVEGHSYFETVRTFLTSKFNFLPVVSLEYLEDASLIFISCYDRNNNELKNDLFVISTEGEMLLRENLGSQLKGIGQDTFFIYGGSVIFVKNRGELFSYKIV